MNQQVIAVDKNGQNGEQKIRPPNHPGGLKETALEGESDRFTYPSGSHPLAGYTIKRGLGHGGFGEVYYATSDAGKEVALKLIRRNLDVELRGIQHCLNLKNPNLLAIHDIREDNRGDKWVVMEYITGECLEDVVAEHPDGLPPAEALRWLYGLGAGVAYLHDHGIVHRDLKPGNVFSDEGIVKIGDYGLSKFISCSRRSGQTESVGTVHYMAPEVGNGRYGKEIDVYALGIILYELLTGRVPFEGESVGEVLMKHLTAEPDVSMLNEPYRSVVTRALKKDPAERYSSVGEMLACLPKPNEPWAPISMVSQPPNPQQSESTSSPDSGSSTVENDEEPILGAAKRWTSQGRKAWNESGLNTPMKILLLIAGLILIAATIEIVVPAGIILAVMYGCYLATKAITLPPPSPTCPSTKPPPANTPQAGVPAVSRRARMRKVLYARRRARPKSPTEALVLKTSKERATELIGSLVGSALVAVTMGLVMVIINSFWGNVPLPEQFAWLVLISIVGAWAILIPSKFWEGRTGEPMVRRFIMMSLGLAVGALAFGVTLLLVVDLPFDPNFVQHGHTLSNGFYAENRPLLLDYMACFGILFFILRWWRQADPLRSTRISLWSMICCLFIAWLTASVWVFPQPWLLMVACTISVAVQLASPWIPQRHR